MIKAAFFDIDGTLLSFSTHRVSEGTIRAFEHLRKSGVLTFISSGRPMVLVPQMPIQFDGYITMNGAYVFSGDQVLVSNPLHPSDRERWLDYASQHNVCTMVFTPDAMMVTQVNEAGVQIQQQLGMPMPPIVDIDQMRHQDVYQAIALISPETDAEVQTLLPHSRLPRWHRMFTDIVAQGNSKAVGMEAMCRHFGIRQEETIAFGDGGNDVEMLQWAGIGVAMGNASDEVKAVADSVTTSVDNEGIERAFIQLGL